MANVAISALTQVSAVASTDVYPTVQGSSTYKVAASQIATYVLGGTGGIATTVVGSGAATATLGSNGAYNLVLTTNTAAGSGQGTITINNGTNGNIAIAPNGSGATTVASALSATGSILSSNGSGTLGTSGIGYATGAGGTVTQITSRTAGVTLNKPTGQIQMFSAAGSATAASFTVTNSTVAATDVIHVNQVSGTNLYVLLITAVAAGSFTITFYTTGGTATDAPSLNFSIIKSVIA
jgi:hypothetical protein